MTGPADLLSPAFLDLVLVVLALELGLGAVWLRARQGAGWIGLLALYLLSGAALIVALRLAIGGSSKTSIALALLFGGVTHVAFLVRARSKLFARTRLPLR